MTREQLETSVPPILELASTRAEMRVDLTPAQLELLIAALDSHEYWQLSDSHYRDSGYVLGRGSDDREAAAEIRRCRRLQEKLQHLVPPRRS